MISLKASLLRSGLLAGVVKIVGAGLGYAMLVAISRATNAEQFGIFGFCFSLSIMLCFIGTVGQQNSIIKNYPKFIAGNDELAAADFLAAATFLSLAGLLLVSLVVVPVGVLFTSFVDLQVPISVMASTSALIIALGCAEMLSSIIRLQGLTLWALVPRDVLWRLLVLVVTVPLVQLKFDQSATTICFVVAAALYICLIPQIFFAWKLLKPAFSRPLDRSQIGYWFRSSGGVWMLTILSQIAPHISTVIVMTTLGPVVGGAFFAADRTARLTVTGLMGVNQMLAPQMSRAYHQRDIDQLRKIIYMAAGISTIFASGAALLFFFFGSIILSKFNDSYGTTLFWWVLLVISAGQIVNAVTGPTTWMMQIIGKEKVLVGGLAASIVATVVLAFVLSLAFGPLGAAVGVSVPTAVLNIWAAYCVRKEISLTQNQQLNQSAG